MTHVISCPCKVNISLSEYSKLIQTYKEKSGLVSLFCSHKRRTTKDLDFLETSYILWDKP